MNQLMTSAKWWSRKTGSTVSKRIHEHSQTTLTVVLVILTLTTVGRANSRILETRFALSSDARSEFIMRFPLLSAGRVSVEANWNSAIPTRDIGSLTLLLIRPDGIIAESKRGTSILRLDYRASEQEVEKFAGSSDVKWTLKILNDANEVRKEVTGTLRITIPAESRRLEDTQFTLLGSGNAQEIPFSVPSPGRLEVDVSWQPDVLSNPANQVALVVSLIHPGESRTYARRQGASPIKVEQQVTEQALDRGGRWIVRVQNDTQTKVIGTVKITYTPSL